MDIYKEKIAIQRLQAFADPNDPYYVCYSGGKDSDCIRILCELANVPYELHHNHTTADAPETVYYVRSIPHVIIDYPDTTMWKLIVKKQFPPTRLVRYCCSHLKERGGVGRLKVTGVRASESVARAAVSGTVNIIPGNKKVQSLLDGVDYTVNKKGGITFNYDNPELPSLVKPCQQFSSVHIHPIVDWSDDDVWDFLLHYGCTSNPLYQCGFKRVGCVGCPFQGGRGMKRDFRYWPKIRANYVRAFNRMLDARSSSGKDNGFWVDGESVMRWWIGDDPSQLSFFEGDDYY